MEMVAIAQDISTEENSTGNRPSWLWKPGQTGNPNGRPKTGEFRKYLSNWMRVPALFKVGGKKVKGTNLDRVMESLVRQKPDVILHYAFGKPLEQIQISDPDGLAARQTMVLELARAIVQQAQAASQPVIELPENTTDCVEVSATATKTESEQPQPVV